MTKKLRMAAAEVERVAWRQQSAEEHDRVLRRLHGMRRSAARRGHENSRLRAERDELRDALEELIAASYESSDTRAIDRLACARDIAIATLKRQTGDP